MKLRTRQHTNENGGGVSAQPQTSTHRMLRCSPLATHTHFMEVTPDTSHLERSPLNEVAWWNIALRTRQHTNGSGGGGVSAAALNPSRTGDEVFLQNYNEF